MKTRARWLVGLWLIFGSLPPAWALISDTEVTVGVLAVRPTPTIEARFLPLIDYLNDEVQGVTFRMRVLERDTLDLALRRNEIDLLLTNPVHLGQVRSENTLSGVLATLVSHHNGQTTRNLGGVIIARKERRDIETLQDLAGKRIASPGKTFLGGYQAPLYEALQHGVDLHEESHFAFFDTHDAVVQAVLERRADAGFIRTGVLEDLAEHGALALQRLKVINPQAMGSYPYRVSTRLYPEWPMVTMPHMSVDLERRVGAALFSLDLSDPVAIIADLAGFGPPADYSVVEDLTRELRLPPFDTPPRITVEDIWEQYRVTGWLMMGAIAIITVLSILLARRHLAVKRSEQRFRRFFEDNGSIMLVFDPTACRILEANSAASRFYGHTIDEMAGMSMSELWVSDCDEWRKRVLTRSVGNGQVHTHRLKSGETRCVEVHGTRLVDNGRVARIFVIVHDVTERVLAENALNRERDRLENVLEATSVATWEWDLRTDETVFNERWASMLGYALAELEPTSFLTWRGLCHPADLERATRAIRAYLSGESACYDAEVRMKHRDGHWVWVLARGRVLEWTDQGEPVKMWGTHQDITRRKEMEQEQWLAASVFVNAREGVVITDLKARIIDVNDAFCDMSGYSREEVIGRTPRFLHSGLQDREFYRRLRLELEASGHWAGEVWNQRKDGSLFCERLTISLVRDSEGIPRNYIALASDITDIKTYQNELEHRANHDALTGLPNRVLMADRMRQEMAVVRRHGGILGVLFIDLDGFKAVNDDYGHDMGDKLLVEMAQDLRIQLRETDTLARISGDEFVILLSGLTHRRDAEPIIARLVDAAATSREIDGIPLQVSASIGYTFYPQANSVDDEVLLKQADSAMYEAKQAGRNRACRFRPERLLEPEGGQQSV